MTINSPMGTFVENFPKPMQIYNRWNDHLICTAQYLPPNACTVVSTANTLHPQTHTHHELCTDMQISDMVTDSVK